MPAIVAGPRCSMRRAGANPPSGTRTTQRYGFSLLASSPLLRGGFHPPYGFMPAMVDASRCGGRRAGANPPSASGTT